MYIPIIATLFVFGLLVYKLFLHHIIFKENVNIFSDVFLYLQLCMFTEDIYVCPYTLFSTTDISLIIFKVPVKEDVVCRNG